MVAGTQTIDPDAQLQQASTKLDGVTDPVRLREQRDRAQQQVRSSQQQQRQQCQRGQHRQHQRRAGEQRRLVRVVAGRGVEPVVAPRQRQARLRGREVDRGQDELHHAGLVRMLDDGVEVVRELIALDVGVRVDE